MNDKANQKFVEMAADPVRRRNEMSRLSKLRTWCSLFAITNSLGALIIIYTKPLDSVSIGMIFMCCIFWIWSYSYQSDLRLLRAIDRLEISNKTLA